MCYKEVVNAVQEQEWENLKAGDLHCARATQVVLQVCMQAKQTELLPPNGISVYEIEQNVLPETLENKIYNNITAV